MTTNCIARCVFAALLLAFSHSASFAQVLWTENFSDPDAAAANWVNGGTNEGTQTWTWLNDPSAFFGAPIFSAPSASDGFFMFDSDANGSNAHSVTLTGPVISLPASNNIQITFWAQYGYFGAPNAELQVSVDGGVLWTRHTLFETWLPSEIFNGSITLDIPEANGQTSIRLRFLWSGSNEYAWKIDDISLDGDSDTPPSACQMNPNAIICDNLDTYDPDFRLGPQSSWWTTWFGTEGGDFDGNVSAEQAKSAPNSVKIVSTSPGGGPQSSILQLDGMSTGLYELKFQMYLPANKTAYYDLRNAIPIVFGGNNLSV